MAAGILFCWMHLGPKSRRLLDLLFVSLLDGVDALHCPSRALLGIGGWADERAGNRQLKNLVGNGWIVWDSDRESGKWVLKLTRTGQDLIANEIDPEEAWNRAWDGKWRLLAFDLPERKRALRRVLNDWLAKRRFGRLQGSVMLTPMFDERWSEEIAAMKIDPSAVSFVEGLPIAGSGDSTFVDKAWNFAAINRGYRELIDFHGAGIRTREGSDGLAAWLEEESRLWQAVFTLDPFLPNELLPKGYLGKAALLKRKGSFANLRDRLLDIT